MKKCPYCAEEIQEEAIKCKHCNSLLSDRNQEINIENFRNIDVEMDFLPITCNEKQVYAGVWKRFCASLVDMFIILPITCLFLWIQGFDKEIALLLVIPSVFLFSMYTVYFNARFGGTLGKLAVGIRITKPNGAHIGWFEAWKRSAVDLVFAFLMVIAQTLALTQINEVDYVSAAFWDRLVLVASHSPSWYIIVDVTTQVWGWSELVVLLFNQRKRALHDFIAGTVVVCEEFAQSE